MAERFICGLYWMYLDFTICIRVAMLIYAFLILTFGHMNGNAIFSSKAIL